MKVAIIGSGFFGITLGLFLSKKYQVDIFEKENKILNGASASNQFRFHYGYHYPRSQKTVTEINKSKNLFVSFNEKNIFQRTENYYLIAHESKVNFNRYLNFLKRNRLYHRKVNNFNFSKKIDKIILSNEKILNYFNFKKSILRKVRNSKLKIKFNQEFKKKKFNKI